MTQHEQLAIIFIAERAHLKPVEEEGHGGPLTMHCFLTALKENAPALGFPPGYLFNQMSAAFPRLVKKGWISMCPDTCGQDHISLTEDGLKQLEEWNAKGCRDARKAGRRISRKSGCVAEQVVEESTKRGSPYAAKADSQV